MPVLDLAPKKTFFCAKQKRTWGQNREWMRGYAKPWRSRRLQQGQGSWLSKIRRRQHGQGRFDLRLANLNFNQLSASPVNRLIYTEGRFQPLWQNVKRSGSVWSLWTFELGKCTVVACSWGEIQITCLVGIWGCVYGVLKEGRGGGFACILWELRALAGHQLSNAERILSVLDKESVGRARR